MSTSTFTMSGIVTLTTSQVEFFTALGLGDVPQAMTTAQLGALLDRADRVAETMTDDMLAGMTRKTLADARALFRIPKSA